MENCIFFIEMSNLQRHQILGLARKWNDLTSVFHFKTILKKAGIRIHSFHLDPRQIFEKSSWVPCPIKHVLFRKFFTESILQFLPEWCIFASFSAPNLHRNCPAWWVVRWLSCCSLDLASSFRNLWGILSSDGLLVLEEIRCQNRWLSADLMDFERFSTSRLYWWHFAALFELKKWNN